MSESSDRPLPAPPAPAGSYSAAVLHGGLAFSAGMTPRHDGQLVTRGVVGREVSVSEAREAAALAAANAVAAVAAAAGGLTMIERCLKLTVYIACTDGFADQALVADAASDAVARWLPGSLPVRTAVGVRALPSGAPVEVDIVAAVRGD